MSREFDVVVYGATGFVGELTARYLAEQAPSGTRTALAGRNETKLAAVRRRLPERAAAWPLIIADSGSRRRNPPRSTARGRRHLPPRSSSSSDATRSWLRRSGC